jgi:cytochrome c peroxidase
MPLLRRLPAQAAPPHLDAACHAARQGVQLRQYNSRLAGTQRPDAGKRLTGTSIAHVRIVLVGLVMVLGLQSAAQVRDATEREPITPVMPASMSEIGKIALGDRLFHERRMSGDGSVSCASCHRLDRGGDDGRVRSRTAGGGDHDFNTPTIFNAALSFRFNWRGEFRTLEEQNEAALMSAHIMNTGWDELLQRLTSDPYYTRASRAAYGGPLSKDAVLDALVSFQRTLVTPDARFDRYLRGEPNAITAEEAEGYRLFKAYGCIACHQGTNVGGNLFQRFGIFAEPPARQPGEAGRFAITGLERDRFVYRVPSLRNVAVTAPYFHDGGTATLDEAVAIMARIQLGRDMPARDLDLVVRYLGTLTGEYRGRKLVGSTDRTPP